MSDHLGIDLSEIVAFGDGNNDKEFLEYAGCGLAMKNASTLAKSSSKAVLEWSNHEDGVARHLEYMNELGCFGVV